MNPVAEPERATQRRVLDLFQKDLDYRYLGDWKDRECNSNIEESLLTAWLAQRGYGEDQVNAVLFRLRTEAHNPNRSLYANNQAVYGLLRYGVPVKLDAGQVTQTVHLVDWTAPGNNDFAIAEEVIEDLLSEG